MYPEGYPIYPNNLPEELILSSRGPAGYSLPKIRGFYNKGRRGFYNNFYNEFNLFYDGTTNTNLNAMIFNIFFRNKMDYKIESVLFVTV